MTIIDFFWIFLMLAALQPVRHTPSVEYLPFPHLRGKRGAEGV